jgi:predicted nuclease with TOPRIM domain
MAKKSLDKDTDAYREKRERNNVAVRKSRNKSKQKVVETEKRVKDLEDENSQLHNKITLLTKELNVLKSLFAGAGVMQSSIKMEGHQISCHNS